MLKAREIALTIMRGEIHPLDGCNRLRTLWQEAGEPKELSEFAALADIYEFHLDQPATIRRIIELAEEIAESE